VAFRSSTVISRALYFGAVRDVHPFPARRSSDLAVGTLDWGAAPAVTRGSCTSPVAGSAIGAKQTCTVLGLASSTAYQFQLVPFRADVHTSDLQSRSHSIFASLPTAAPVASVAAS